MDKEAWCAAVHGVSESDTTWRLHTTCPSIPSSQAGGPEAGLLWVGVGGIHWTNQGSHVCCPIRSDER